MDKQAVVRPYRKYRGLSAKEIRKPMRKSTFEKSSVSTSVLGMGFSSESNTAASSGGKAMGMRKITGFACMALAAVLMALPCHAGEKNNKHVKGCEACFANGTGKQISRISLISDDGKKYDFTVDLQDKAICVIGYPKELKKNGSVSVEVEFENGKTASTKVNEVFSFARRPADNVFLLSLKGKNSTVPIVSGTVAGGATAAAITGAASYCVAHWGAGGLTWLLAYFGGSMVTGLAFVSAVPVAIAAVTTGSVFAVRKWMMPETLVVQKLTKDQALLFSDNQ